MAVHPFLNFIHPENITLDSVYDIWIKVHPNSSTSKFLEYLNSGIKGQSGMSAYQFWLTLDGNAGKSFSDFINSFKGPDGKSAYTIWLEEGHTGSESDFISSLKGIQGEKGPKGDKGPTGNKGATGDRGATGPKGVEGDVGPQGERGPQGPKGYTGIEGIKGPTGFIGTSAFEIWAYSGSFESVDGEEPTEEDYIASLKGAKGDKGDRGDAVKGETGDKGPVGDKGETGDKGPVGDKGETGNKGPTGDPGSYPSAVEWLKFTSNGSLYGMAVYDGNLVLIENPAINLTVTTPPTKTDYSDTDIFNPSGMVVYATFLDGTTKNVTSSVMYNTKVEDGETSHQIKYQQQCTKVIDNGPDNIEYYIKTTSVSVQRPDIASLLQDFTYVNQDGMYHITGWKETLNGKPSTECVIPDSDKIKIVL